MNRRSKLHGAIIALVLLLSVAVGCDKPQPAAHVIENSEREPCTLSSPTKRLLFGDLHVHTGFSFDARNYQNVLTPDDAYDFAKGGSVLLPPLDPTMTFGTREVRIDRPLDFVGLTDHAEFLGEIYLCSEPASDRYESQFCIDYRNPDINGAFSFGLLLALEVPRHEKALCGEDGRGCEAAARIRWKQIQEAAERHYDRTKRCSFTTFIGYEYTNTLNISNMHRNVFFRNAHVPDLPIGYVDAATPPELWRKLKEACLDAGTGCDVLIVPHNPNLSNGNLFLPVYPGARTLEEEAEQAKLRITMEPLVEIFQHKGDSECRNGLSGFDAEEDPLCYFEKLRPDDSEDCGDEPGTGGMRLWGCSHRLDFVRNVLKTGLLEEQRIGVNPYALGIIASTDSHNGTPGHVRSEDFPGHVGVVDDTPEKRLGEGTITHDALINNPGGLTAVWATENTRDAIFDALRSKEVYATSGPRIRLRFFAGWGLPTTLCSDPNAIATAYEKGVPMGSYLAAKPPTIGAPTFFIKAEWDAGTTMYPGTKLQRVQIIKGWVASDGRAYERVYEVAGDPNNGASVDLKSCAKLGDGAETLCTVWSDPDFEPSETAFYYVRVVENPTCRWSMMQCNILEAMQQPLPPGCSNPRVKETVQQRAWSSPIWYRPTAK
ncbi:MAG: DUF3604 domain-containing protein [Myxococcales bacterium]|nr:DUF3604 domain-containing protein [Myxococcales bacterium]